MHVFPCALPPPNREKAVRGHYTTALLNDAVRAVLRHKMNVNQAAAAFKIPRSTLQRRVSVLRSRHEAAIGRNKQEEEEQSAVERAKKTPKTVRAALSSHHSTPLRLPTSPPILHCPPDIAEECEIVTVDPEHDYAARPVWQHDPLEPHPSTMNEVYVEEGVAGEDEGEGVYVYEEAVEEQTDAMEIHGGDDKQPVAVRRVILINEKAPGSWHATSSYALQQVICEDELIDIESCSADELLERPTR